MVNFIVRSFLYAILIIIGVMTVTFLILRVLPGDPARLMLGQRADLQSIESLRKQLKLDQPMYVQYADFMARAATGDLGRSYAFNRPVMETILEKLPATAYLSVTALLIASVLGIAIGVISSWKPYSALDNSTMVLALLGYSTPVFVFGLLLIIVATGLHSYPGVGYMLRGNGLEIKYLMLPMIALAARPLSIIARITRSSMLDVLSQDYIRTARAKGLPTGVTFLRHGLRNAMNPDVTTISAWLASTLAGTLFIEQIFNWPGIGQLSFEAVLQLDFPVIQGTVLVTAVIFVIVNFLVDIVYALLDPKVRLG
jgi:peptide/nickel transport system permease protein